MSLPSEERIRDLTGAMWRKELFAVLWDGGDADLHPHLAEHLEYMIGLERAGKLFASGPLDSGASSDGLTVLRAGSPEEAESLVREDPFFARGLRRFRIRRWTVMEGSFGVTVNFSDRSSHLT